MDAATALAKLRAETDAYRAAEKEMATARERIEKAVIAAFRAGARPTDVADASPFTSTYTRRIAREHGIAPARGNTD